LDTASHLAAIGGPVLLVHGERDALIGVHHARNLHAVRPSARLLLVPGAGHNDIHEAPRYRRELQQALVGLWPRPGVETPSSYTSAVRGLTAPDARFSRVGPHERSP